MLLTNLGYRHCNDLNHSPYRERKKQRQSENLGLLAVNWIVFKKKDSSVVIYFSLCVIVLYKQEGHL